VFEGPLRVNTSYLLYPRSLEEWEGGGDPGPQKWCLHRVGAEVPGFFDEEGGAGDDEVAGGTPDVGPTRLFPLTIKNPRALDTTEMMGPLILLSRQQYRKLIQ